MYVKKKELFLQKKIEGIFIKMRSKRGDNFELID